MAAVEWLTLGDVWQYGPIPTHKLKDVEDSLYTSCISSMYSPESIPFETRPLQVVHWICKIFLPA